MKRFIQFRTIHLGLWALSTMASAIVPWYANAATLSGISSSTITILPITPVTDPPIARGPFPDRVVRWYYNPSNEPSHFQPNEGYLHWDAAIQKWMERCDVTFVYMGTSAVTYTDPSHYDGVTVFSWNPSLNPPGFTGTHGITHPTVNGSNQTTEADIAIFPNETFDPIYGGYSPPFDYTMLHELGHLLGLGHTSNVYSIMNPDNPTPGFQTWLGADDIAACQANYGDPATYVPTHAEDERIFNYYQARRPDLFSPPTGTTMDYNGLYYRYYSDKRTFLGVKNGRLLMYDQYGEHDWGWANFSLRAAKTWGY